MMRLNLAPAFNLAHAAMPRLVERGGGRLRRGVGARRPCGRSRAPPAYVTSKAAVLAFIQALDADYRTQGMRANAILPSVIDTPANRAAEPDADHSKWVQPARDREGRALPRLGRLGAVTRRRDPGLRARVVVRARSRRAAW